MVVVVVELARKASDNNPEPEKDRKICAREEPPRGGRQENWFMHILDRLLPYYYCEPHMYLYRYIEPLAYICRIYFCGRVSGLCDLCGSAHSSKKST